MEQCNNRKTSSFIDKQIFYGMFVELRPPIGRPTVNTYTHASHQNEVYTEIIYTTMPYLTYIYINYILTNTVSNVGGFCKITHHHTFGLTYNFSLSTFEIK